MKKKYRGYTEDGYVIRPNKTALKREHHHLQAWAKKFIEMKNDMLAHYDLPEHVLTAIELGRRLNGNAQMRHMKHIANLLADIGLETIAEREQAIRQRQELSQRYHSEAEHWCQQFINTPDETLERFFEQYPWAERQHIRQLVKGLHKSNKSASTVQQLRTVIFDTLNQQNDWLTSF